MTAKAGVTLGNVVNWGIALPQRTSALVLAWLCQGRKIGTCREGSASLCRMTGRMTRRTSGRGLVEGIQLLWSPHGYHHAWAVDDLSLGFPCACSS